MKTDATQRFCDRVERYAEGAPTHHTSTTGCLEAPEGQ